MREFDPAKNERNIRGRGLDFARVTNFDFRTAQIKFNLWQGELRKVAVGFLDACLCVLVYVRKPMALRVISLKKATRHEVTRYEASRSNLEPGS